MGCCRSNNKLNQTHPECDIDPSFDGVHIDHTNSPASEPNEEMCKEKECSELKAYIERQKKFEEELRQTYAQHTVYKQSEYKPLHKSSYITKSTRMIKPFLSSTFRDFFEEREFLFKQCFPFIEKKCIEKGLHFIPIDLRWGVTAKQCNSGQVIKICLDEIDNSRPYFLCFLGFRNGWSLANGNNNDELLLKTFDIASRFYPWVHQYKKKSVTELEILHGVLLQEENIDNLRCIFYIKSVDYLQRQIGRKSKGDKYKTYIDFDEAETNLMTLKQNIIKLKQCKVHWFNSCEELSNQLKTDLFRIIDDDFPMNSETETNVNNKEMYTHKLFRNLLTNKVYIDTNHISVKLNQYVHKNKNKNILVVYGDSGMGKSTVLAHFDENQREDNEDKDVFIISRYIGISIESNAIISLLKSIENELLDKYIDLKQITNSNDSCEEYDENDIHDVMSHLYTLLEQVLTIYGNRLIVIIFESINEFQHKQFEELQFLNLMLDQNTNPKIKLILSTSNQQIITQINEMKKNNVATIELDAMNKDEIAMFIKQYLSQYGKVLDDKQKALIIEHEKTVCNPLFLSIFLEEMRCFGSFENLNEYMTSYISVKSISELFEKVMTRLQHEFEAFDDILKHTLCLLFVSRNGLLPNELELSLESVMNVSKIENTFPVFEFTSLMHQLSNLHFIRQVAGKYIIIHQFINEAIHSKYFKECPDNKMEDYLNSIYKSFTSIYKDNPYANQRFINQVPHCLYTLIHDLNQNQYKDALQNAIGNVECIQFMKLPQNIYDFHKYWNETQTEEHGTTIDKCFKLKLKEVIDNNAYNHNKQMADYYHDIAIFMVDTGRYDHDIEYFLTESLRYYEDDPLQIESVMFELAKLHQKRNEFQKSLKEYTKCVNILSEYITDDDKQLKLRLLIRKSGLAGIQKELNQYDEAITNYENCLQNKIQLLGDNNPLVAIDMINVSNIYINILSNNADASDQNCYLQKAQDLAFSAKQIFENNFGSDCLQLSMVYSLLGYIYQFKQKYNLSIKYLENAKSIKIDKLGSSNIDLVQCLSNLGNIYLNINDMERSLTYFNEAFDLILKYTKNNSNNSNLNKLILCHNNLSTYFLQNKQYDLALQQLIECRDIMQETLGETHVKLIDPLMNLADIYNRSIKDFESAHDIYQQVLHIIDINKSTATHSSANIVHIEMECFHGLADLYLNHYHDYDKSIKYLDKQLNKIEALNDKKTTKIIDVLHDKIAVFIKQKQYIKAWSELQQILTMLDVKSGDANRQNADIEVTKILITTFNICGNVMFELNRQNDCIQFYEKQLQLIRSVTNSTKNCDAEEDNKWNLSQLLQLLAILHFGNQNLSQSKKYFELYLDLSNCDNNELNVWLNDINQAEQLLSIANT